MNSFEVEKRIEEDALREILKRQEEEAEKRLAEELRRIEEETLEREEQHKRDWERLQEAEDLDAWYNAMKTIEIRQAKEEYELREAMKRDAEEAFEKKEPPIDSDDGERDPDLNITPSDNTEELEREEEEEKKKAEEAWTAEQEAEKERLEKERKLLEEQEAINQEEARKIAEAVRLQQQME